MFGTVINALVIVVAAVIGLVRKRPISGDNQTFLKLALGLATMMVGLRLAWLSVHGSAAQIAWQLGLVVVAMMLGKLTGRLLRLQRLSNRLGRFARERIAATQSVGRAEASDGLNVCAALFCAAPMGIVGAISEGLGGGPQALMVKAVMDGLAAYGFVAMFGRSVALASLPVLAFQGSIALVTMQFIAPFLQAHHLADSVNATAGLLIFCVSLLVFEVKRIQMADYLPSLVWAPLLTAWLG